MMLFSAEQIRLCLESTSKFILAFSLGFSHSAFANSLFTLSLEELLSLTVATPSRHDEALFRAPATVVVVSEYDIKNFAYRDLQDALQHTLGIEYSNPHSWLQGGQRGFASNFSQTKLLINGRENNLLWSGEAYISNQFPLANVKRIEIIHGPASALYGADAFVGVINVITKNSDNTPEQTESSFLIDSLRSRELSFFSTANRGNLGITFSANTFRQSGPDYTNFVRSNAYTPVNRDQRIDALDSGNPYIDDNRAYTIDFALDYRIDKQNRVKSGLYTWQNEDGGGHENAELIFTNFKDVREQLHFYTNYQYLFDNAKTKISLDYHHVAENNNIQFNERNNSSAASTPPLNIFELDGAKLDTLEMQIDFPMSDRGNYLLMGASYRKTDVPEPRSSSLLDFNDLRFTTIEDYSSLRPFLRQNKKSFFIQDQQDLYDGKLSFLLGVRYDYHNIYKEITTFRGSASWEINRNLSLKLLYGEAFREPLLFELAENKDLKPARMETSELSLHYVISHWLIGEIGIFNNNAMDIVEERRGSNDIPETLNIGRKRTQGLESRIKFIAKNWNAYFDYSYTVDPDSSDNSYAILNVPRERLGLGLVYRLNERLAISWQSKYTDKVYTNMVADAMGNETIGSVDRYQISNVNVILSNLKLPHTTTKINFQASIINVFNRRNRFANMRGPNPRAFEDFERSWRLKLAFKY